MSRNKLDIPDNNYDTSDIRGRILWLVDYLKRHEKQGITTDKAFLEKTGLNSSYLSDLRNGKIKNPTADVIGSIVTELEVSPYWLLDELGEPFTDYLSQSESQPDELTNNEVNVNISQDQFALFLLNQVEIFAKNLKDFLFQRRD